MRIFRPSNERGYANHDWLKTYHTFSFADYYDENWMGFKTLRVINEDYIAPNLGFDLHPHRNMEIITYIIKGKVEHTDNMGNKETIEAGEIQQMSAGTGVYHSEKNPSSSEELHLLQIWIMPIKKNVKPQYAKKKLFQSKNQLNLIITNESTEYSLTIHQNAKIYSASYDAGQNFSLPTKDDSAYWVQIIQGQIMVDETKLSAGDGLGFEKENTVTFKILEYSEFLIFELN